MTSQIREPAEDGRYETTWSNLLCCVVTLCLRKVASTIKNHNLESDDHNSGSLMFTVEISVGATLEESDSAVRIAVRDSVALFSTRSLFCGVAIAQRKNQ